MTIKKCKYNGVHLEFHQEVDQHEAYDIASEQNAVMIDLARFFIGDGSFLGILTGFLGRKFEEYNEATLVISMEDWKRHNTKNQVEKLAWDMASVLNNHPNFRPAKITVCGEPQDLELFITFLNLHSKKKIVE